MKKLIYIIILVATLGSMYYFSSQDGVTSTSQSNKVIEVIDEVRDKVTLKNEKLIKIKDNVFNELRGYGKSYVVRKVAHFTIYACIGISMVLAINSFTKKIILSSTLAFIITGIYALFDEYRQLSVIGRSGSIKDVIIDSSGAFVGIIMITIFLLFFKSIKNIFNKKSQYEIIE